ncbi:putative F-box protein [Forsythia ovata]|uniref:F-box protein n=1 Tax=Forsythia ovata TaxID=205694 RepID=A0ABD1RPQ5_9LAMI
MHYSKEEGNQYVLGYNILRVDADLTRKRLVSPSSCNFTHVWLRTINVESVFYILKLGLKGVSDIDCVDLENEHVTSVNVPQNFFSEWSNVHPVNWDGKLALAGIEKGRLRVWVLENYKKRKWVKSKIVIPLTFMKDYPTMLSQNMVPYAAKDNRICWFHVDGESRDAFYLDIESKKIEFRTCSIILEIHLG